MDNYITTNGFRIFTSNPNVMFATILSAIPDLEYWSQEAIKALVVDFPEMISVLENGSSSRRQKAQFRSFRRKILRFREYMPESKDLLLEKIYDLMLSCDGLGLLHGFGFSNRFGDRLMGNPEYQSIYN